jgi:hypothetical protein
MAVPMACDNVFGPRVDASCRAFDFTLFFEDVILACLPNAVFLLLLPLPWALLFQRPDVVNRSNLLTAKLARPCTLSPVYTPADFHS